MPNYRKILYLYEMGVSQRQISVSEHMSRNTVSRIIKQAQLHSVCSDQLETLSDSEAEQLLKVHINEPGDYSGLTVPLNPAIGTTPIPVAGTTQSGNGYH